MFNIVLGLCPKIKTRKAKMDVKIKREESKLPRREGLNGESDTELREISRD